MTDPRQNNAAASRDAASSDALPGGVSQPKRGRWVAPRITDHGSLRHMVRGSTGIFGDKGGPLGRRN